ncbi:MULTISPECIES: DUF4407 domain-containing protein [Alicyclobacillus]|uniref:Uncharacterized protein n=1 Tax=Alicyclobacillus tolerans TaxID=90970 RepID=A0ABT9M018_9BACL|nr:MULTISPECIES: DUF4407 domain-containing protein [Alicyclobacillus]MDP9729858.1 hypothetical protein [Alicyclobacillus tengchongensis]
MGAVIRMYLIWILALLSGVYGTSLVYEAIIHQTWLGLVWGVPILFLGIWITGNMWASARQFYRKQKSLSNGN